MKIALIGPGIMSIPPPGWGAVEILMMEYYTILKKSHDVDIINIIRANSADSNSNTEYSRTLINTINSKQYDFVHIHYDVLYHIIPHLLCKHVGITSHFPYIDQPHLYGEYDAIFRGICESRAYIFALCKKDQYAFIQGGASNVLLLLNGSNQDEIIPNKDGIYNDRSVYIAKIELRKRQTVVSSISTIDFYGKTEDNFRYHPHYKGELSHIELMKVLPNYGNLVLLSDGEAAPLVVKEALMAGLPIVISQCCGNDIDCTLPFIDVISEDKIHDIVYVNNIIEQNRQKKHQYTEQIRQYAVDNFSWQKLIDKYLYTITSLIEKNLTIAIVGPGLMPIPPVGWGACEILVWNYACELRKQGHNVEIINTPHTSEMILRIQQLRPDFVHIQFDNYGCIIPHITSYCKAIAITSHFAYLEQRNKWGSYVDIWNRIIQNNQKNLYHFVLSEGIANVYQQHGIEQSKIIVTPNGADPTLFTYIDQPKYPDRSIVVAKVERRKGQYLLQHNPQVWFAGNHGDDTFDYSNPRWLGEWNKETLYKNLTDYGNLVLLSEGEADPLVVKEAFASGLGVVVSQWATANLDISLPFITVIPNDKIYDRNYVDDAIEKNRIISVQMRSEIKEYGKQFHWDKLITEYVKYVRTMIIQ